MAGKDEGGGNGNGKAGKLSPQTKVTIGVAIAFGCVIASATAVYTRDTMRLAAVEKENEALRAELAGKMDRREFQGWVRELQRDPSKPPDAPR